MVRRNDPELITVVQNTVAARAGRSAHSAHHMANDAGELDLLPFEQELVDIVNKFIASRDADERRS